MKPQIQAPIMVGDSSLVEEFGKAQNRNDMAETLKELFDEKKIYMISDLSRDEARLMTRIYIIAKMKKKQRWLDGLAFYSKIVLSNNRKSRTELLKAIAN